MGNTSSVDVFESFESSFQDKTEIPEELELIWMLKAIARFSIELYPINFDKDSGYFDSELDQYVIDTLAAFMKQFYQEREVSKVNKRVSIRGKDISIDGTGNAKTAAKYELDYDTSKSNSMIQNQKPTAYV